MARVAGIYPRALRFFRSCPALFMATQRIGWSSAQPPAHRYRGRLEPHGDFILQRCRPCGARGVSSHHAGDEASASANTSRRVQAYSACRTKMPAAFSFFKSRLSFMSHRRLVIDETQDIKEGTLCKRLDDRDNAFRLCTAQRLRKGLLHQVPGHVMKGVHHEASVKCAICVRQRLCACHGETRALHIRLAPRRCAPPAGHSLPPHSPWIAVSQQKRRHRNPRREGGFRRATAFEPRQTHRRS